MIDPGTAYLISSLIGLGGGIFGGMGQSKANQAQIAAQERMQQEQLAYQRQLQGLMSSQMDPLVQQRSRQNAAMMSALVPNMRNASVSSGIPGMDRFIPQVQGGFRLPPQGLPQSTLDFFSPQANAQAEGAFYRTTNPFVNPNHQVDLSKVGYGQAGAGLAGQGGVPPSPQPPRRDRNPRGRNAAMLNALR